MDEWEDGVIECNQLETINQEIGRPIRGRSKGGREAWRRKRMKNECYKI